MLTLPQALADHLTGETTTLCHCWKLTRADGVVLGFTDHDATVTFDGDDYEPRSGFTASEAEQKEGLSVDGFDVEGALDSERLSEADIAAGIYSDALVDVFVVNWASPAERVLLRRARVGTIARSGAAFRAELVSAAIDLDKPKGRLFMRRCDAELGDVRCGKDVSVAPFRVTVVVTGHHSDGIAVSGIDAEAAGWFTGGTIAWTENAQAKNAAVADHLKAGGGPRLLLRAGGPVPPLGAAAALTAGCDKLFGTCKAKFANHERFRGFPHLPGNDAAYAYVTDGIAFDGGPLVP